MRVSFVCSLVLVLAACGGFARTATLTPATDTPTVSPKDATSRAHYQGDDQQGADSVASASGNKADGSAATPDSSQAPVESDSLFARPAGEWSWTTADTVCVSERHTIAVAEDRQTFTIRDMRDTTGTDAMIYVVERVGAGILPERPHTIRARVYGEERRTQSGALVVWDLVLLSPDRYTWHRADWPPANATRDIVRCRDGRPVRRSP